MTCEQVGCDVDAVARMYWPGHPPTLLCFLHELKAVTLADAMGFYLHVEPLDPNFDPSPGGTP